MLFSSKMKGRKEEEGDGSKTKEEKNISQSCILAKTHLICQEGQRGCNVSLHHLGLGC